MNSGKTRATLLGVVEAYMFYLAYQLFESRADTDTTMTPAARILFIAFFVLAGIAVAVYTVHVWRHSSEQEEEQKTKDDENSLK